MHDDITDLRNTIVPKLDQVNAEMLLAGPMTITVTGVTRNSGIEQPLSIHYEGEDGRPFKPCLTMRKLIVFAWGENGHNWAGRSMTLFNDPRVKWGGVEVGGIRISHLSHIEGDIKVSLASTRGKKDLHTVKLLQVSRGPSVDDIANAPTVEALKDNFGAAYKATKDPALRTRLKATYDARLAALTTPVAKVSMVAKTLAEFTLDVEECTDAASAQAVVEAARTVLNADDYRDLQQAYRMAFES